MDGRFQKRKYWVARIKTEYEAIEVNSWHGGLNDRVIIQIGMSGK